MTKRWRWNTIGSKILKSQLTLPHLNALTPPNMTKLIAEVTPLMVVSFGRAWTCKNSMTMDRLTKPNQPAFLSLSPDKKIPVEKITRVHITYLKHLLFIQSVDKEKKTDSTPRPHRNWLILTDYLILASLDNASMEYDEVEKCRAVVGKSSGQCNVHVEWLEEA